MNGFLLHNDPISGGQKFEYTFWDPGVRALTGINRARLNLAPQSNLWMELTDSCISISCFEAYNSNTFQLSSHTQNRSPWMLFLKASKCPEEKWLEAGSLFVSIFF